MGFGWLMNNFVKGAVKESLDTDFPDKFSEDELKLAANKFVEYGIESELELLRNERTKRATSIEIFKRIVPKTVDEIALSDKINRLYDIT